MFMLIKSVSLCYYETLSYSFLYLKANIELIHKDEDSRGKHSPHSTFPTALIFYYVTVPIYAKDTNLFPLNIM